MSNAGQAIAGIAGGVIGFLVGGPAGALYGFQIGLLAGSVLSPTQLPTIQGPRLEDFERIDADPGAPIAIGWGTFAVPGFRLYLGEVLEQSTTEEVGGKGAPEQEQTTYTYKQTIALGLCEGPIDGVSRIWENGKIVFDARPQQEDESSTDFNQRLEASTKYAETFELYLGDEDQMPDPTLEEEQGAGNVQAFRELAYIVYPNRVLQQDQGNRHPGFKFEIGRVVQLIPPRIVAVASTAAGGSPYAMYSDDGGETWQGDTDLPAGEWTGICHSAALNLYVAVRANGNPYQVATSPDGKTWTLRSTPVNAQWTSVCWSEDLGVFVAVSGLGTPSSAVMRSVDGVNWVARTGAASSVWHAVIWSKAHQRFVAGCTGNLAAVQVSDDGETWTLITTPSGMRASAFAEKGGRIVCVNESGGTAGYSDNGGLFWTALSITGASQFTVAASDVYFIALFPGLAGGLSFSYRSPSGGGGDWGTNLMIPDINCRALIWSTRFKRFVGVAFSKTGDDPAGRSMFSASGDTWQIGATPGNSSWSALCEGRGE